MSYLRCIGTGLWAALLAAVLWVLWAFALPILTAAIRSGTAGAGSITVVLDTNPMLAAAGVGFVAGFAWRWRQLRATRPTG
jgi:hypothetical protein